MPLFDFFKKFSEKQTTHRVNKIPKGRIEVLTPSKANDTIFTPERQKKRYDAAMEFLGPLQERFIAPGGKAHAGTVLSAAAWLAGTSLYRSFNYKNDIVPGTVVLSEIANQEYPKLLNMFAQFCLRNGIDVMARPLVTQFPEKDKPQVKIEQVREEFQDRYHEIMQKYGLDFLDEALAGIVVCSIVFQHHTTVAKDIDPYVATGLVAMGVVEGSKTAPMPLKATSQAPAPVDKGLTAQKDGLIKTIAESSTSGSGTRLVLGEPMATMKEALGQGGKYILIHPAVLEKLKQGNIDPFIVYEAAMRTEAEQKISSFDFVDVNVDELLQKWSGKPGNQAPIPVRQMLWLLANADGLGYEKNGNSWVLKR